MPKKKAETDQKILDPFVGGEDDDLMDMEYIQDEHSTTKVETHPPETDDELAAAKEQEEYDPTPPVKEEADEDDVPQAEETEPPVAKEAEEVVIDDGRIPKDRFVEVNERMKRAEERVKQLEKQIETVVEDKTTKSQPEPEPYDYAAKESEAMDALLEGDSTRYSQIQAEIRQAARDEAIREAKKLAAEGDSKVRETLTFEETAAKIEAEYPQFVETSEVYNREAYEELMDLYLGYAQSGRYSRVDAMRKAADKAAQLHNLKKTGKEEPLPDNVVNLKAPNIAEKAKVASSQPPRKESGASGKEEPRVDVMSMSDEQYQSLPESTKRRLRGDIL